MSLLQVLKLGIQTYNKNGYRLGQIVELSVPKYAADIGVNRIKRVTISHINGEEKLIETWLGKDGKAIKTIHTSSLNPNERIITDYNWSVPKLYDKNDLLHQYWKKDNPYIFDNMTGKIKKRILVRPKGKLLFKNQKVEYINLDINKEYKTVTKSIGTVEDKFNTSEIYSIQNGKKVKGLSLKAEKQDDGTYKTVDTNYFGISILDSLAVFSDKYFHSRFLPTPVMAKCCVGQAAKDQGVSYIPKLFKSPYPENCVAYKGEGIGLSEDIANDTAIHANVVDTINHESRHLRQYELEEKYAKGELTNPKEIEMAKQYKYNHDNYVTPFQDEKKYREQLVEDEAYSSGKKARNLYFDVTHILKKLFDFSTFHSVGA